MRPNYSSSCDQSCGRNWDSKLDRYPYSSAMPKLEYNLAFSYRKKNTPFTDSSKRHAYHKPLHTSSSAGDLMDRSNKQFPESEWAKRVSPSLESPRKPYHNLKGGQYSSINAYKSMPSISNSAIEKRIRAHALVVGKYIDIRCLILYYIVANVSLLHDLVFTVLIVFTWIA